MKNKIGFILIGCLVLLFLIGVILNNRDVNNRKKNYRYTIGLVIEQYHTMGGTFYKTKYNVLSIEYIKNFPSFGDRDAVGKRYFVKFEKGNPENAELIDKYIAKPDAVAPDSGWVKIPGIPDDKQP